MTAASVTMFRINGIRNVILISFPYLVEMLFFVLPSPCLYSCSRCCSTRSTTGSCPEYPDQNITGFLASILARSADIIFYMSRLDKNCGNYYGKPCGSTSDTKCPQIIALFAVHVKGTGHFFETVTCLFKQ